MFRIVAFVIFLRYLGFSGLRFRFADDTEVFGGSFQRSGGQDGGLQPLTVKMISQASQKPGDDAFYVDGLEINNVRVEKLAYCTCSSLIA